MSRKLKLCERCKNETALYSKTPKGKAVICHGCASLDMSGNNFYQVNEAVERLKRYNKKHPTIILDAGSINDIPPLALADGYVGNSTLPFGEEDFEYDDSLNYPVM